MAGKYLYGVVKNKTAPGGFPAGIAHEGLELYTVPYRDIACVVSDSNGPAVNLSQGIEQGAVLQRLARHQTAVESIMLKQGTVIPIKFETVLNDDEEVEKALIAGYSEFSKRLDTFDGKAEVDVTARWASLGGILKKIGEEDEEIRRLKGELAGMAFDKTVDERVKIGFMVKKALDRRRNEAADVILERLRRVSFDSKPHDCANDDVILICAFLVDRDKESVFHDALERLNEGFKEEVRFRCVSPLPPYAFAAMAVEKIGRGDVEKAREILGLGADATADTIREAFRRKALESHPDKKAADRGSSADFEETRKAYVMLKNCSFAAGDFFYVHEITT
ncbi:MAG: GvpL/GvpF family gas vesicle protein [Deltaproteobacteria bacterium]|nr:GvpL/GvpF family gas vesicle protein [Deltaproteobacteria bacterium]